MARHGVGKHVLIAPAATAVSTLAITPLETGDVSAVGKDPRAAGAETAEPDAAALATGVALAAAAGFGALLVHSRRRRFG